MDPHLYRSIIGTLQYVTLTGPDDGLFAVNQARQHMHHDPSAEHVNRLKRILKYVKGTLHFGIHINRGPLRPVAYSDADWVSDALDRRSNYRIFVRQKVLSKDLLVQYISTARSDCRQRSKVFILGDFSIFGLSFRFLAAPFSLRRCISHKGTTLTES